MACRSHSTARAASPRRRASSARRNAIDAGTLASTLSARPTDGSCGSSPLAVNARSALASSGSTTSRRPADDGGNGLG